MRLQNLFLGMLFWGGGFSFGLFRSVSGASGEAVSGCV